MSSLAINKHRNQLAVALVVSAKTALCLGCGSHAPAPPAAPTMASASGKQLFQLHCWICHQPQRGRPHAGGAMPFGPVLSGLVGSKAGTVEGFQYTPALSNCDIVWSRETLTKLIEDPQALVPGIKMPKTQLDQESIRRLVDHLETL